MEGAKRPTPRAPASGGARRKRGSTATVHDGGHRGGLRSSGSECRRACPEWCRKEAEPRERNRQEPSRPQGAKKQGRFTATVYPCLFCDGGQKRGGGRERGVSCPAQRDGAGAQPRRTEDCALRRAAGDGTSPRERRSGALWAPANGGSSRESPRPPYLLLDTWSEEIYLISEREVFALVVPLRNE